MISSLACWISGSAFPKRAVAKIFKGWRPPVSRANNSLKIDSAKNLPLYLIHVGFHKVSNTVLQFHSLQNQWLSYNLALQYSHYLPFQAYTAEKPELIIL